MSILAKKMSAVTTVPESYAALGTQLVDVRSILLEAAQPYVDDPLRDDVSVVVAGRYKAIFDNVDPKALCYVIGTQDSAPLAIVQISKTMAQLASQKKLGAKAGGEDAPALALLDLVLMQSTANLVLDALKDVLGSDSGGLKYNGRHLSIENVSGIDEAEKWVQLTLPVVPKEATDGAYSGGQLNLTLLFSAIVVDSLTLALSSGVSELVIDPGNPWSSHMHGTVMQSTLPLKVIVEVLNMSVAECTRLSLGQVIALPGASHRHLSVSTESGSGLVDLAASTLGVAKSNKAVKLLEDIDPEFLSDIGDLMLG